MAHTAVELVQCTNVNASVTATFVSSSSCSCWTCTAHTCPLWLLLLDYHLAPGWDTFHLRTWLKSPCHQASQWIWVCIQPQECIILKLRPDALRHAKTRNSGRSQNTRYINKISTLWIIYHQKGLDEEIPKQQTKLRNLYSILRYKRNTKMSKVLYHNSNKGTLWRPWPLW